MKASVATTTQPTHAPIRSRSGRGTPRHETHIPVRWLIARLATVSPLDFIESELSVSLSTQQAQTFPIRRHMFNFACRAVGRYGPPAKMRPCSSGFHFDLSALDGGLCGICSEPATNARIVPGKHPP